MKTNRGDRGRPPRVSTRLALVATVICLVSPPLARADLEFQAPKRIDTAPVAALDIGDISGDGRNDVVAYLDAGTTGSVQVYRQDASGELAATPEAYPSSGTASYGSVDIADLNGDGLQDAAVANAHGIDLYYQNDSGMLEEPVHMTAAGGPEGGRWPTNTRSVQAADLDEDGDQDLVAVTYDHGTLVLRNGDAGFASETVLTGPRESQEAEVGDLNADSRLDIASGPFPVTNLAFQSPANGFEFDSFRGIQTENGLDVSDVSGDGLDDLLITAHSDNDFQLFVFAQEPDGPASTPTYCHAPRNSGPVESADMNGDGRLDAVVMGRDLAVYQQTPSGALSEQLLIDLPPASVSLPPDALALGDVTGDGLTDAVLGGTSELHLVAQAPSDTPAAAPVNPCDVTPPTPQILSSSLEATTDGDVPVEVLCADSEQGTPPCNIAIEMRTLEEVTFDGHTTRHSFGSEWAVVQPNEPAVIQLALSSFDRDLLARLQSVEVELKLYAADGAANTAAEPHRKELTLFASPAWPPPPPTCMGREPTAVYGPENDNVVGTELPDVLITGSGADTIRSLGGDDLVCAGAGNDLLIGGDNQDHLFGGSGADHLRGGRESDELRGGRGRPDRCRGGHPTPDTASYHDVARKSCERVRGALRSG